MLIRDYEKIYSMDKKNFKAYLKNALTNCGGYHIENFSAHLIGIEDYEIDYLDEEDCKKILADMATTDKKELLITDAMNVYKMTIKDFSDWIKNLLNGNDNLLTDFNAKHVGFIKETLQEMNENYMKSILDNY